jgi:ankyrin repeat protein
MLGHTRKTVKVRHFAMVVAAVALASVPAVRSADTSLLDAVRASDPSGARALLAAGADPDGADETGVTPLMYAAGVGSLHTMQALIEAGADVNAAAADGTTALMWAAADASKVRLLLEHGAAINAVAKDGTTPLVAAAQRGAADVMRLLFDRHADPLASGDQGAVLYQAAFSTTNPEVRRVLAARGLGPANFGQIAPALNRVDYVDHDLVTRYLEAGGDPNLQIPIVTLKTPLLGYAAMISGPDTVGLLLQRGADPNAASSRGATPLMMAAASDHADPKTVRMLLSHGARLDARDDTGRSALDWALLQGETDAARVLREAGVPSSPVPSMATTPLVSHPRPLRVAVEKAVATMNEIGPAFYRRTGCISCHNTSLPAMARQAASARGVAIDPAVAAHATHVTIGMWRPRRNASFVGRCGGNGYVPTVTYGLVSMAEEGVAANSVTDAAAVCLSSRQSPDGAWRVNDIRPPLSGNAFLYTALAIRGLDAYAPPALRDEMQRRIELARSFLMAAEPHDTQDESMKLMGLVWAKAPADVVAAQAQRVLMRQRRDGGWGQTPLMEADAYATGQALHALRLAGTQPESSAYASGVRFLLRTQREDGSWYVPSRGFGFQPYYEYGFPHGRSQFLSAAATSWAVMALAPAL